MIEVTPMGLLMLSGAGGSSGGEAGSSAAPYDLYGTDDQSRGTIPFTVTWPTAPSTSNTYAVPSELSFAAALSTPNAIFNVAAGSYGALNISQNDQRWNLDDAATFSSLNVTGDRVAINGGVITDGAQFICDDLLMMNCNVSTTGSFEVGVGSSMCNRMAFIHNTIVAYRTGFFSPGATASDVGAFGSDFILCANYIQGGMTPGNSGVESGVRIMSTKRAILVDNRVRCGFDGQGVKHTYRSHYGNEDFWMRRNMNEYGDGIFFKPRANASTIVPNNYMGDHWVYDTEQYTTNLSNFAFRQDATSTYWPGALVTDGNDGYTDAGEGVNNWLWSSKAGDSIGTDTANAYQAPPALASWLAADGLQPGADH